jgi:hypothetical protein
MRNLTHSKSRFAPSMHFAPTLPMPSLTQVLAAVGLVAIGVGIGAGLAPMLQRWNQERGPKPRRSAPVHEIDRWANEGGAVAAPAFKKVP